jgi:predicted nucleotidyltransferase component of viral defense system
MKREPKRNLAASVRARLYDLSKERREDFNLLLTRFALERFLFRLGQSTLRERFVSKGAALFTLWFDSPHRPTRDLDLLGSGNSNLQQVSQDVRAICNEPCEDGLVFVLDSVHTEPIRVDAPYIGARVKLLAALGTARIDLQIDNGYGDAVTPPPNWVDYRTLLSDLPQPHVRAYSVYTTVAEKFDAMATLNMTNTRMKDFYDLWHLSRAFAFDGVTLSKSIRATFERRGTTLPTEIPIAFTDEFSRSTLKTTQWQGFVRENKLNDAPTWSEAVQVIRDWLMPVLQSAQMQKSFEQTWHPGAGWR